MKIIPVKTPEFVKTLFPNLIWNITTSKKEIYLTFDDGPTPEITNWVLNELNTHNAKATFFCIGNNIETHPEIFKQIISKGHTVGNHTYNHLKGWKHKTKTYIEDVEKTNTLIHLKIQNSEFRIQNYYTERQLFSKVDVSQNVKFQNLNSEKANTKNLKLFRPPYGKFKTKQSMQLQKLGYKIIMWDVLSYDWNTNISENTCLKNVTSKAKEGSIIVFHDSIKASKNLKYVLPKTLEYYSKKGFQFKAL